MYLCDVVIFFPYILIELHWRLLKLVQVVVVYGSDPRSADLKTNTPCSLLPRVLHLNCVEARSGSCFTLNCKHIFNKDLSREKIPVVLPFNIDKAHEQSARLKPAESVDVAKRASEQPGHWEHWGPASFCVAAR